MPRVVMFRRAQTGLSLVELMIGIAVGLFIVAAATLMTTSHLDENRRLLLETQVQQDLRAAADLITRDLRRAGTFDGAAAGVWGRDNVNVVPNPNLDLTDGDGNPLLEADPPAPVSSVLFAYSEATAGNPEAGFRLNSGAIDIWLGEGGWHQLTDPATLTITRFEVNLTMQTIDLSPNCLVLCAGASCPTQQVRTLNLLLVGRATNDAQVVRSLRSRVRLPNDVVSGQCPDA